MLCNSCRRCSTRALTPPSCRLCRTFCPGWSSCFLSLTSSRWQLSHSAVTSFCDSAFHQTSSCFCVLKAASWLEGTPAGLEVYVQEGDEQDLTELLSHPSCRLGNVSTTGTPAQNLLNGPRTTSRLQNVITFSFSPQWVHRPRRSFSLPGPTHSFTN